MPSSKGKRVEPGPNLSRVRNSMRDMAESMRRFDANFKRMQCEMKRAGEEGATDSQIRTAANEALRADPDLLRRVNELTDAMAAKAVVSDV